MCVCRLSRAGCWQISDSRPLLASGPEDLTQQVDEQERYIGQTLAPVESRQIEYRVLLSARSIMKC